MQRVKTTTGRRGNRRRSVRGNNIIHKIYFLCITIVFVFILTLSVFSLSAKANSTAGADEYKYYTSHLIEHGESLWSIATDSIDTDHYDSVQDYIEEIKFINGLSGDDIQSGNYLLIPYFSAELK